MHLLASELKCGLFDKKKQKQIINCIFFHIKDGVRIKLRIFLLQFFFVLIFWRGHLAEPLHSTSRALKSTVGALMVTRGGIRLPIYSKNIFFFLKIGNMSTQSKWGHGWSSRAPLHNFNIFSYFERPFRPLELITNQMCWVWCNTFCFQFDHFILTSAWHWQAAYK